MPTILPHPWPADHPGIRLASLAKAKEAARSPGEARKKGLKAAPEQLPKGASQ